MKIAVVNDIHLAGENKHKKYYRVLGEGIEYQVEEALEQIEKQSPELLMQLGDLIAADSGQDDQQRYLQGLKLFKGKNFPVVHLAGNHEIRTYRLKELEDIWAKEGFEQKSFGKKRLEKYLIAWLGLEKSEHGVVENKFPEEQINWLRDILQDIDQQVILFLHNPIDEHSTKGNYYFSGYAEKMKPENYQQVKNIVKKSGSVKMVVSGHAHWLHGEKKDGIIYLTLPSMTENIAAPGNKEYYPQIYSLINIKKGKVNLRCYSGEYCFASLDFSLTKSW